MYICVKMLHQTSVYHFTTSVFTTLLLVSLPRCCIKQEPLRFCRVGPVVVTAPGPHPSLLWGPALPLPHTIPPPPDCSLLPQELS